MCEFTFISRASDGLFLVEAWNDNPTLTNLNNIKIQAKNLLKNIKGLNSNGCIEDKHCNYYYQVNQGICYMTVCATSYPRKLAFSYLQEIQKCFVDELIKEYGPSQVDFQAVIESIEKPYTFIRLDTAIIRKSNDYRNPDSSKALEKLNQELKDVESIVLKNISDVIDRGSSLQAIGNRAHELKGFTGTLKGVSRTMMMQAKLQKYIPYFVMMVVLLFVILWKFFL